MNRAFSVVGALVLLAAVAATAYAGGAVVKQRIEISAPILPNMIVWQYKGGAGYPGTPAERLALVTDSTYSYEFLLASCAPNYPIVLAAPGQQLSKVEIEANYDQVSRCAYERFGAKPYWVPKILNDLDVCATKLGAGWRLPTEADLATFTEADYQFFKDTMSIGQGADWFPRQFYFSLDLYVRGNDGTLRVGNMTPGVQHVSPNPVGSLTQLHVGDGRPVGVRCVRTTTYMP